MKEVMEKEGIDKTEAFQRTQKTGHQKYSQHLKLTVSESSKMHSKTGATHVIFLDKNHPNERGIGAAIKDINSNFNSKSVALKKLFLIPELSVTNQYNDYPFSENFLAQIYAWGQNRTNHETLNNDDPCKMVEIQTMFIKMHKGTEFDDKYLEQCGLDGYLRLPMSVESFTIPEELSAAMKSVINNFRGITTAEQGAQKNV